MNIVAHQAIIDSIHWMESNLHTHPELLTILEKLRTGERIERKVPNDTYSSIDEEKITVVCLYEDGAIVEARASIPVDFKIYDTDWYAACQGSNRPERYEGATPEEYENLKELIY